MDQMSNMSYKKGIQRTFDAAKAQGNGKKRTNTPKIIGKGGYVFELINGTLVQHYDPKVLKFLARKEQDFVSAGLLNAKETSVAEKSVVAETSELIAEL